MSEMIERLARAMVRDLISPSRHGERVVDEVMETPIAEKVRKQARAALKAMREPTEAMATAGYDAALQWGSAKASWSAMIDEALK